MNYSQKITEEQREFFSPSPVSEFTQFSDNMSNTSLANINPRFTHIHKRNEDSVKQSEARIQELEDTLQDLEENLKGALSILDDVKINRLDENVYMEKIVSNLTHQMQELAEKKEIEVRHNQSRRGVILGDIESRLMELNQTFIRDQSRADTAYSELHSFQTLKHKLTLGFELLSSQYNNDSLRQDFERMKELQNQKRAFQSRITLLEDQIEHTMSEKMNEFNSPQLYNMADELRRSSISSNGQNSNISDNFKPLSSYFKTEENEDKAEQLLRENHQLKQQLNLSHSPGLLLKHRSSPQLSPFVTAKRSLTPLSTSNESNPSSELMMRFRELEQQMNISQKNEEYMINTIKKLREKNLKIVKSNTTVELSEIPNECYFGENIELIIKNINHQLKSLQSQLQSDTQLRLNHSYNIFYYLSLISNSTLFPVITIIGVMLGVISFQVISFIQPQFRSILIERFLHRQ